MSSVVKLEQKSMIEFSEDQVNLIKRTIAPTATNDELSLFLHQSKKMGLDPLAKQIYFQKYVNKKTGEAKMTIIVSIDGYRLIADRTGAYAGSDDPIFDDEKNPSKATVTVYKMVNNVRCPFTSSARWEQYCPSPPKDYMWQKMPHLMLGKVAESLALRKAFPAELGGSYINEEMEQAAGPGVIEAPTLEAQITPHAQAEQVVKLQTSFAVIGVSESDLVSYIGKNLKDLNEDDVQKLRGYYLEKKGEK